MHAGAISGVLVVCEVSVMSVTCPFWEP
jgi:hypothetical protein